MGGREGEGEEEEEEEESCQTLRRLSSLKHARREREGSKARKERAQREDDMAEKRGNRVYVEVKNKEVKEKDEVGFLLEASLVFFSIFPSPKQNEKTRGRFLTSFSFLVQKWRSRRSRSWVRRSGRWSH